MFTENKEFLFCDCSAHALSLSYDEDIDKLDIAFWQMGSFSYKLNYLERFKLAFKVIFQGKIYADMVILDRSQRIKLLDYLNNIS